MLLDRVPDGCVEPSSESNRFLIVSGCTVPALDNKTAPKPNRSSMRIINPPAKGIKLIIAKISIPTKKGIKGFSLRVKIFFANPKSSRNRTEQTCYYKGEVSYGNKQETKYTTRKQDSKQCNSDNSTQTPDSTFERVLVHSCNNALQMTGKQQKQKHTKGKDNCKKN